MAGMSRTVLSLTRAIAHFVVAAESKYAFDAANASMDIF